MTARVFVDTNVLVYERDASEPVKQRRAFQWIRYLWQSKTGFLSYQVLQEFYVTVVHKLRPGLPPEEARQLIRDLTSWQPVEIDLRVLETAWAACDRHALSWWDALIVAAAKRSRCRFLLTEDLQHGQDLGDLEVINPFEFAAEEPADVVNRLGLK